ncbi:hypothetical protein B0G77_3908 [Paraburkholderia sp. BL10I2N1]|nr:hypothetical protein B0G77_3908 [Paraburkholderia sp. BL10I2N1]
MMFLFGLILGCILGFIVCASLAEDDDDDDDDDMEWDGTL